MIYKKWTHHARWWIFNPRSFSWQISHHILGFPVFFCCGGQLRCSFDGMLSEWFRRMLSHEIKKTYWLFFIGIFMSSLTIYYISPTSNLDRVSMSSPPNKYPKNKPPPWAAVFSLLPVGHRMPISKPLGAGTSFSSWSWHPKCFPLKW